MTNTSDSHMPFAPDLRRIRADQLTGFILAIIEPYLCEHHPDNHAHKKCAEALLREFCSSGAEIITDFQRSEAGLPPRGEFGLTAYELQTLEERRLEMMTRPTPYLVLPAKESRPVSGESPGPVDADGYPSE